MIALLVERIAGTNSDSFLIFNCSILCWISSVTQNLTRDGLISHRLMSSASQFFKVRIRYTHKNILDIHLSSKELNSIMRILDHMRRLSTLFIGAKDVYEAYTLELSELSQSDTSPSQICKLLLLGRETL